MAEEIAQASTADTDLLPDNARRCLVTGTVLQKAELIRFVVDPSNQVVPDVGGSLPGRGMWVIPSSEAIDTAVRKNLFSRAAKTSVQASEGLTAQTGLLLRKRCLDFLGLSKRSGIAVLGQPQVEAAIRAHKLGLLAIATDASENGLNEVTGMSQIKDLPIIRPFTRHEMGAALGYDQVVYMGLIPHRLTKTIRDECNRLDKYAQTQHVTATQG